MFVLKLRLLASILPFFGGSVLAASEQWPQCYPGFDCASAAKQLEFLRGSSTVLSSSNGPIVIEKATAWEFGNLKIEDGTQVLTRGHPLTIYIAGDLVIEGTATFLSFEEIGRRADSSAREVSALNKPSPQSEVPPACPEPGCVGAPGQQGAKGIPGAPGQDGKDAGPIRIVVIGRATGNLVIINKGTDGSDGENGSAGQVGGTGGAGGAAVSGAFSCAKGPGVGGRGGDGGAGGRGGPGGRAGNGGDVAVVGNNLQELHISVDTSPGQPGHGGRGGSGGGPGQPGLSGSGSLFCLGAARPPAGDPGVEGPPGINGSDGTPGRIGEKEVQILPVQ